MLIYQVKIKGVQKIFFSGNFLKIISAGSTKIPMLLSGVAFRLSSRKYSTPLFKILIVSTLLVWGLLVGKTGK